MTWSEVEAWFKIGWPFRMIGAVVGLVFILLLLAYSRMLLREMIAMLHKYGMPRAEFCRWDSCGLFDAHAKGTNCLSPFVFGWVFRRRKATGQKAGCRNSLALAEAAETRRSAREYRSEYLNEVVNLRNKVPWGSILMFLAGLTLLLFGAIGWETFIKLAT